MNFRGTRDYGRFIEEMFRLTAGQLRSRAKIDDDDLAELVKNAVTLRNGLVHGWLIYAGMDAATGRERTADQRRHLQAARRAIDDVRTRLTAMRQAGLAGVGGPELTPEQVAELWRRRQGDTAR